MKELWIDAGMPKNGTSARQVFLAKNRESLLKEGIDYIELINLDDAKQGEITSGNAAIFARSLLDSNHQAYLDDHKKSYDKLLKYIKENNSSKFLISSEFLFFIPVQKYKQLIADLNEINTTVKFIYYVRRQDQFLMSSYMQQVKRHGYTGYPETFILDSYQKNPYFNYYGIAKNFENTFGENNLYTFIYEHTKKHPKGLIGHFIENILGYCPEWLEKEKSINTSPSPFEIKLLLIANKHKPRMVFSDFLIKNSIISGHSKEFSTHNILSPTLCKTILDYFSEQNKLYETRYAKGETFPSEIEEKYIDLKNIEIPMDEFLDLFTGYLVSYDKRIARLENLRN